jgi:hypothetical protein
LEERLAEAKATLQRLENAQAADYAAGIDATETDMVNAANAAEDVLFFEREVNAEREHQRGLEERRARIAEGEKRVNDGTGGQ